MNQKHRYAELWHNRLFDRQKPRGNQLTMYGLLLVLLFNVALINAGPAAVGLCYTACNAAYCTCMASSGLVAGATGPVGWYAWLTGAAATCSLAQGACMTACTALAVAPTP